MASITHSNMIKLITAATATGASSAVAVKDFSTAVIQVSGISGDTVTVESRVHADAGWDENGPVKMTNGDRQATISANGLYRITIAGLADWRVNVTGYSAGNIDVWGRMTDM